MNANSETSNPKLNPAVLAPRILQVFNECGYGERGGQRAFLKVAAISSSEWHNAVRAKKTVSAGLLQRVLDATNARPEWIVEGELPVFEEGGAKKWAGCKAKAPAADKPQRATTFKRVRCGGCGKSIPRRDWEAHTRECKELADQDPLAGGKSVPALPGRATDTTAAGTDGPNAGELLEELRRTLLEVATGKEKVRRLTQQIASLV